MEKELLTVEFRYYDEIKDRRSKTITIGIYDTLEEVIKEGNKVLKYLSCYFQVKSQDKFEIIGLFGDPKRLVTNCCYPTNNIQYFAKITKLKFENLQEVINNIFSLSEKPMD